MNDGSVPVADPGAAAALSWVRAVLEARESACRALAEGESDLREVLDRRHRSDLGEVHLLMVLEALPGSSKVAARRALEDAGIPQRTRLRDLDAEQVGVLVETFPLEAGARGTSGDDV
ncbi:MAG: hypothetical protein R2716_03755 [Microthrixaceae bacterium]